MTKSSSGRGKGILFGFVIPVRSSFFLDTFLFCHSLPQLLGGTFFSPMTNLIYCFSYLHFKVTSWCRFFFTFVFQLGSLYMYRECLRAGHSFTGWAG